MTIISFNKSLVRPAYDGLISLMEVHLADSFYERIKNKNELPLKKFEKIVGPKGFFDLFDFSFDSYRKAKFAAIIRVFYEKEDSNSIK